MTRDVEEAARAVKTSRHAPVACYTPRVAVSATPGLTSDSVAGSGASPDRRGNLSISRPAPEFCMDPVVVARFWEKVDKNGPVHPVLGTPCWMWRGNASGGAMGYGRMWTQRKAVMAHRFSYELLVGVVPAGLVLDHLCRVVTCVNPSHLEPVTNTENVYRGVGPTATLRLRGACKSGHPFSKTNTRLRGAIRVCRSCQREFAVRRRATLAALRALSRAARGEG